MNLTFYDELGVQPSATAEELKAAYRILSKELHPDVNGGDPVKTERFARVCKAYEVLSDPPRRANYDTCGLEIGPEERKIRCGAALAEVFQLAIEAEIPPHFQPQPTILMIVRDSVAKKQSETYGQNRREMAKLERFLKAKRELKFKGEGPDRTLVVIDASIQRLNAAINVNKANLILYADMLELLKSYELDPYNLGVEPGAPLRIT